MRKSNYFFYIVPVFLTAFIGSVPVIFSLHRASAQLPTYDVAVTGIRFLNGTGRGPTSPPPDTTTEYYRGYGMPGTMIEITANMTVGGNTSAPMYGDVSITVSYTDGGNTGNFTVSIPSGSHVGTAAIPCSDATGFLTGWIASGSTISWTYQASSAAGDYVAALTGSANENIYWDRDDFPSSAGAAAAPYIDVRLMTTTTTSLSIYWVPVDTAMGAADGDFYEYRVYFRESTATAYRMWNGSNDATLRGLANNPASPAVNASRHFADVGGTVCKYTTITNLKIFTGYDFYVAAVDLFGNEIPVPTLPAEGLLTQRTQPFSIQVAISDGITRHTDFTDLATPTLRTLREVNTKVELYIVATAEVPDTVQVWFASNATDATLDIVDTANNTDNSAAFTAAGSTLYSVSATRTGSNTWVAYIPTRTEPPLLMNGTDIRFVVETSRAGARTFSDRDMSELPPDPNNNEWNYHIGTQATYTPWPTRILNNVISDKNPIAYPAYYLSEDAYVTITVYDIKGRPVVTLLDKSFRRGGQNIKEEGWDGINKSRRKVGVGLYYIHIQAKRTGDSKIILDSFEKVVVTR